MEDFLRHFQVSRMYFFLLHLSLTDILTTFDYRFHGYISSYFTCPWRTYSQPLFNGFTIFFFPQLHLSWGNNSKPAFSGVANVLLSATTVLGVITQNLYFQVSRMYFFLLHLSLADILTAFLTLLPEVLWTLTYPRHEDIFLKFMVNMTIV